jgi:hypothetical protein
MKKLKENWKLEPLVKKVCLVTTIYYSVIIALAGLIYLSMFLFPFSVVGDVLFSIICWMHIFFYWTKVLYVPPIIITMFLLSVAFTELVKRKNPRVFVHPLVLSSIASSVVGTVVITNLIERAF